MSVQSHIHYQLPAQFSIKHAAFFKPFSWLGRGWLDLIHHPKASLSHGLIVSGLFLMTLLITSMHVYVLAAVISGALLIGPIMAAGLCEISRRREKNEPVSFDDSLSGLSRNQHALVGFASMLLGFGVAWFVLSGLVLMAAMGEVAPAFSMSLWGDFMNLVTPVEMMLYLVVGGLLASMVFVVSVVSVPAIIDSSISALDAVFLSIKVAASNIVAMLIWAALIVLLAGIGLATFLVGMIVIYPLLGHASWHAYRDLVINTAR